MSEETLAQVLRGLLGDNPLVFLENDDGTAREYFLSDDELQWAAEQFIEELKRRKYKL